MPHTGGAYSFARAAMGPWGGFVTGLAETIEYVATTAVIVYFSASYADCDHERAARASRCRTWVWWVILYVVFIALNSAGAAIVVQVRDRRRRSSRSAILARLRDRWRLAPGAFDLATRCSTSRPTAGRPTFLPLGVLPILFALPFAMWFFLGIEELPLAAEESHNPARTSRRPASWARVTLIVTGLLVLFLNTGGHRRRGDRRRRPSRCSTASGRSWRRSSRRVLALFALIGLLASLQGIMFAYGRNMYSLSRAGYYPKFLSLTGKRQTPWVALVVGAVIGFIALVVLDTRRRARTRTRAPSPARSC